MIKVCLVHNYYKYRGGEDQVFEDEANLMESYGHPVVRFSMHNKEVDRIHPFILAKKTIWNGDTYAQLKRLLKQEKPDVVHFHNTLPLISPAAYFAVRSEGLPVIQTLHNYRLVCPGALCFRDDRVCEDCLGKSFGYPGILHKCYRNSRSASATVASMLTIHRLLRTWTQKVTTFIALTDFARQKYIQGGIPADNIVVKPNFTKGDPGIGPSDKGYAIFVGRLNQEKGVKTLIKAWERLHTSIPLKILGEGPLGDFVAQQAKNIEDVEWLGFKSHDQVLELMKGAAFMIFPSTWYEGLGLTILEAYATGTPVVASNIGSPASVVLSHKTGLHFEPNNAEDLAQKVEWLISHPTELAEMRLKARARYEERYTAEQSYHMLLEIYEQTIQKVQRKNH